MDEQRIKDRFRTELRTLATIDGVSGHEDAVVSYLRQAFAPLVDRVAVDALGNVYAMRTGGKGPHLLVVAHSDEIGALVAAIEPDGFLRLEAVGGVAPSLLVARKVRVAGHRGVIGVRPGHLQSPQEARTAPELPALYVDLGFDSRAEVEALGIRSGDMVVWESAVEALANPDRVAGKGIDNRIGCLIVLELLRALKGVDLAGPLTVAVAAQEEVGLKGARVVAEHVRPDRALVVDTTPCPDTPDSRGAHTFPVHLGGGPVVQVSSGPHGSGYLMLEHVRNFIVQVAQEAGIAIQLATFAYGNTDAGSIYTAAGGIPTAPITVARRYSHSPVETLDLNDAVDALRLCVEIVRRVREFPAGMGNEGV